MEAATGFAGVNGTRLHFETRGTGASVLFIHGFTLDHRMWSGQVAALATAGFRAVAYDGRGFGRSALPSTEAYRHCDDAAALIEHLGCGPALVVGHSIGALYALEVALSRPDLVAGVACVCPSGLGVPFTPDLLAMFAALRAAAAGEGLAAAKQIWTRSGWFLPLREVAELAAELDAMVADYTGWHWTHDNPAKNIDPPADARLEQLTAPTLVIGGERDLPYNHAVAAVLARRIPGARHVHVAGGSHMAAMDRPLPINEAIADMARSCLAQSRR